MNESFLNYRSFRYLKWAIGLVVLCSIAYYWHEPMQAPNGGTVLGYVLGTIGALLILWLIWYGVRKHRFNSNSGTVRGWLSGHVYLGTALVIVATLHSGFQFGWNIHTLAWVLMILVVLTGLYGAFAYARYPALITNNRNGENPDSLLRQLNDLETEALRLADSIGEEMHHTVVKSFKKTRIGGNLWQQLWGRGSLAAEKKAEQYLKQQSEKAARDSGSIWDQPQDPMQSMATVRFVASQLATEEPGERVKTLRRIMELLARKRHIVNQLNRDIQQRARLQLWLYLHIPLTFALLAALLAHVMSVFFYW
ncbi:MAG TPA: hypothetical protein VFP95_04615 [Gammaproteobacteria bacterium]|nr:hypothetical protein [Gammaproteobacteria bacterium]